MDQTPGEVVKVLHSELEGSWFKLQPCLVNNVAPGDIGVKWWLNSGPKLAMG